MVDSKNFSTFLGIVAILIWSTAALYYAMLPDVDNFTIVFASHCLAAVLFIGYIIIKKKWNEIISKTPWWFPVAGILGFTIHAFTYGYAIHHAPPLEASLLIYSWPLLVVIVTTIIKQEKLNKFHFIGGVLGFLAMVFLFLGKANGASFQNLQTGHFAAIICSLSWVAYSAILVKHNNIPFLSLGLTYLLSTIVLTFYGVIFEKEFLPSNIQTLFVILTVGAIVLLAYSFWMISMAKGNASLVGVVSFLTPVLSVFWLIIFDKDEPSLSFFIALLFTIFGIGIAKYGQVLKEKLTEISQK
jgi:drug/metabolite transporter (DMT)-like permease